MVKTTLVYPSVTRHTLPPLGVAYLAAVLRENGHDVNIIDFNVVRDQDDFKKRIRDARPDIVGFSVQTNAMRIAFDSAKAVREMLPDALIAFGGPHPTVMPEHTLNNSEADAVIIGEGEYTILDLVRAAEDGKPLAGIRGLWYRENGSIKRNEPRPFIRNLDELPFPARDLLPMEYYLRQISSSPFPMRYQHIHAHRGCPFNCKFCQPTAHRMWGRTVRKRSPASLCDEAEMLIDKYRVEVMQFSADTFTVDKKWVRGFCEEYRKRRIGIPWVVGSRVDTVDYEMLKDMKRSGCIWLGIGVESGSQKILDTLGKGTTAEQTERCFRWCNEVGILAMANIMMGNPGETREDLEKTVDLVKRIKPDTIAPFFTNPICGTHLYDYAVERGLLKTDQYEKLSRHNLGNMKLEYITERDLKLYREKLLREYLKLRLSYIFDPRMFFKKMYLHRAMARRYLSILRNFNFDAFRISYKELHTHQTNPVKKVFEMVIKGM